MQFIAVYLNIQSRRGSFVEGITQAATAQVNLNWKHVGFSQVIFTVLVEWRHWLEKALQLENYVLNWNGKNIVYNPVYMQSMDGSFAEDTNNVQIKRHQH